MDKTSGTDKGSKKKLPSYLSWLAIAGLAWGAGFVYNVHLGSDTYWLKKLYQNKMAIAAEIDAPKLIIAGGSGAHYTVDSDLLSQEINRPVVNLGLDGPIGLDVILPSILTSVNSGDIVLLIPEYLILEAQDGLGEKSGVFGLAIGQPGLGGVPVKQVALSTLQLGIPSLRYVVKSSSDLLAKGRFAGYYDGPLTERGDPTETKQRTGEWWPLSIKRGISPHAVRTIEQFKQDVEARGAELILSMPVVYADVNEQSTIDNVQKTADTLADIAPTVANEQTLNLYAEPTLFADTHYHLQPEGRTLRAQQLSKQLQPILSKSEAEE